EAKGHGLLPELDLQSLTAACCERAGAQPSPKSEALRHVRFRRAISFVPRRSVSMKRRDLLANTLAAAPLLAGSARSPQRQDPQGSRITVLYDAFGRDGTLQRDWGYCAFVEIDGKRILFDTGNSADVLERNAKGKGIDLSRLDFVVMSHRHGDHMGGMSYLLAQ